MPIYAYRCESCGFAKDVLRKISDPLLTDCPQCGKSTFRKQVTAAGFQLKGSGWYVTDFREGGSNTTAKPVSDTKGGTGEGASGAAASGGAKDAGDGGAKSASGSSGAGGDSSAAPAAAPAATSAAKPAAAPSSSSGNSGSSGA